MKSCSIRDVAREAGVSPGAVSCVMNNKLDHMRISDKTYKQIRDAARKLNYTPNVNARRLFSRHSGVIGMVAPSHEKAKCHPFADNHLSRMISGMEETLAKDRMRLLLVLNDDSFMNEKQYISLFRERNVDALVIWGACDGEDFWSELATEGNPYLFLGTIPSSCSGMNHVSSNYADAGYAAARHLLALGHRKLAWIGGKPEVSTNREHETGIRRAMAEFGLEWDSLLIGDYSHYMDVPAVKSLENLLASGKDFTALLTANYNTAEVCLRRLWQQGFTVPGDFSLACCDSYAEEAEGRDNIDRIVTHDIELGAFAAMAIKKIIENPAERIHKDFKVDFITGETSADPGNKKTDQEKKEKK